MRKYVWRSALLAALAASLCIADEGRTPIAGPTTITAPGHYIVTRDFSFASGIGILIRANNVTLDLDGHTITGPACSGTENVVQIDTSSATQGLVIRNGRLVGGCSGIASDSANRVRIRIERVEVTGTVDAAIKILAADWAEVTRCHIHDISLGNGIGVLGATGSFRGRISDNVLERIGAHGIDLDGMAAGEVLRNSVVDFGLVAGLKNGIILRADSLSWGAGGNLVEGNTIRAKIGDTEDDGIRADVNSPYNLIVSNVVTGAGRIGINSSTDGTRIEKNVANRSGVHGIQCSGSFTHMEENQAQGNNINASGCGLKLLNGNGHVFRNNNLRGNSLVGACGGTLGTNTDGGGNLL